MGWKYKAGLVLMAAVVSIWVISAEVTQVSFSSPLLFNYSGFFQLQPAQRLSAKPRN